MDRGGSGGRRKKKLKQLGKSRGKSPRPHEAVWGVVAEHETAPTPTHVVPREDAAAMIKKNTKNIQPTSRPLVKRL